MIESRGFPEIGQQVAGHEFSAAAAGVILARRFVSDEVDSHGVVVFLVVIGSPKPYIQKFLESDQCKSDFLPGRFRPAAYKVATSGDYAPRRAAAILLLVKSLFSHH